MARSDYFLSLDVDVRLRYEEKVKIIDNIDPYTLSIPDLTFSAHMLPKLELMDLVNYLILTHSFYTGQQLKAYKSLKAYKYYEAGFVQEVLAKQQSPDVYIVLGKVKHSQKTREKVLKVWVVLLSDGAVSSAHCTCMAGLGEVCSHVAAVLFYLHAREEVACTDKLSQWPVPATRNVDMVRIRDMDWARKSRSRESLQAPMHIPAIEEEEFINIIRSLKDIGISPVCERLQEPFATEIEQKISDDLPDPLMNLLFSPNLVGKPYDEIMNVAKTLHLSISLVEVEAVEKATRDQDQNNLWFKYRARRITASKFKGVCRTTIARPSLSLIKGICYPEKVTFFSKQTTYGKKHEAIALEVYLEKAKKIHQKANLKKVGFYISLEHPEFGASPDGLINCECCGSGCVEVKCPYTLQDISLEEYVSLKTSFLVKSGDTYILNRSHGYYYQVQMQMYVTKLNYCDFIVWSRKNFFVERIRFNNNFCMENIMKSRDFFNYVIKLEIMARYFTQKGGSGRVQTWCTCQIPDDGRPMLKCDNDDCEIGWYHFDCVGIIAVPNYSWFCINCT